jgi:hypothetical protein
MFDVGEYAYSHELYERKVKDLQALYGNGKPKSDLANSENKTGLARLITTLLSAFLH